MVDDLVLQISRATRTRAGREAGIPALPSCPAETPCLRPPPARPPLTALPRDARPRTRDPRPPRLQARASREGGEPKFTGHHLLSESVASLLPRAGLGGLEKRFSKSMPCGGTDSCPVDSHLRVRKEKIPGVCVGAPRTRRSSPLRMRSSTPSGSALILCLCFPIRFLK